MKTPTVNHQFDPMEQMESAIGSLDVALLEAEAIVGRMQRLRGKIAAEMEAARQQRAALEIYTEIEAAEQLRINPKHLGDLRRRHDLPHIDNGKISYTRQHLAEITEFFEIRGKQHQLRKAA